MSNTDQPAVQPERGGTVSDQIPSGQTPPAGWYPDNSVDAPAGQQRYWNGSAWTEAWKPATAPTTAPRSPAPTVATVAYDQPLPAYPAAVQQAPRNGLGTAALVLGIIGAVSGVIPLMFWLAGTLGLIGLILGFIARGRVKRGEATNGMAALWGIITSAVSLVLSVVGLVLLVGVLGTVAEDVSTTPEDPAPQPQAESAPESAPAQEEPAEPAPEAAAGIGDAVVDGDFTFVVTSVEDGPPIIGTADFGVEPQGKFVLATLTVTNNGDTAGSFFGSNQYLVDTEGRKASADDEAAIYLDEAQSLYEQINPGNSLTGVVVFDIPVDAVPASLELHDSAFSGGVTVTLTP